MNNIEHTLENMTAIEIELEKLFSQLSKVENMKDYQEITMLLFQIVNKQAEVIKVKDRLLKEHCIDKLSDSIKENKNMRH